MQRQRPSLTHFRCLLLGTLVTLAAGSAAAAVAAAGRLVGALDDPGVIDGCSWSARSNAPGQPLVFLAEYDGSVAVMNIGGRDVRLSPDSTPPVGDLRSVGRRLTRVFVAPGIRVKARFTTTWKCPANQPSCEVTRYDVVFDVKSGDHFEVVRARGEVGC